MRGQVRSLEREGPSNLYSNVKSQRMSRRQMDSNIESHVHPSLLANERVQIQKYQNNEFKRGLQEDEQPFPVMAKLGPYVVSNIHYLTSLDPKPCLWGQELLLVLMWNV